MAVLQSEIQLHIFTFLWGKGINRLSHTTEVLGSTVRRLTKAICGVNLNLPSLAPSWD